MSNKDNGSDEPVNKELVEKKLNAYNKFGFLNAQSSHLEGKMLTIIDASYSDREQRDAIKSLVKKEIRNWSEWVLDLIVGVEIQNPPTLPDGSYPKSK